MDIQVTRELESSLSDIPFDNHFKLYAGPGAGKTTFLVNHIKRILNFSERLKRTRKIACITYTNAAVNTVLDRVDGSTETIEITTIHSFCYKHIVKPYMWLLEDLQFPLDKIDGHEEIKLRQSQIRQFKFETRQNHIKDDKSLVEALSKLKWILEDGKPILKYLRPYEGKVGKYSIIKDSYLIYKKLYWSEGKLSHDDILYYAFRIVKENPEILEVLRTKFPYILIDEFQDTSPIQTELIKMIGEKETIIGVIGDVCQSIFSFQGADVNLFQEFLLTGMSVYTLSGNRRSTNQIINILNHIRNGDEVEQFSPRNLEGPALNILVGDRSNLDVFFKEKYKKIMFLSYRNRFRGTVDILMEDSDSDRSWRLYYLVKSLDSAKKSDISQALKFMKQAYRSLTNFTGKEAIDNLRRLSENSAEFEDITMTSFYNEYIYGHYGIQGKISRGRAKDLYDNLTYKEFYMQIASRDNGTLDYKTIHQSKGEEYESVCVILPAEDGNELNFLLGPDMNDEAHRVYYVALSRARRNLFVYTESIASEPEEILTKMGFEIVQLSDVVTEVV